MGRAIAPEMCAGSIAGVLLACVLLGAAPVQAASISYFLDQSNGAADGVNYLQVTIADGSTVVMGDSGRTGRRWLVDRAGSCGQGKAIERPLAESIRDARQVIGNAVCND